MRALHNQSTSRGARISRKNMFPDRRGAMVLRGLHPAARPYPAVHEPQDVQSLHLPALSASIAVLAVPSLSSLLGVSRLQDTRARPRSYPAERCHGPGSLGEGLEERRKLELSER